MNNILNQFKALSDGNRLRVLAVLFEHKELCACQITELLDVKGATSSRHLSQMVNAKLLVSRKEGRWVYFKINPSIFPNAVKKWIQEELFNSEIIQKDLITLNKILEETPEDLCEKQRSGVCCL